MSMSTSTDLMHYPMDPIQFNSLEDLVKDIIEDDSLCIGVSEVLLNIDCN